MPVAVELYFEKVYEQRVFDLWHDLADRGFNVPHDHGAKPHLSLALFEACDVDRLLPVVEAWAAEQSPVSVDVCSVGAFRAPHDVAYLAPVVSASLLEVHVSLHEALAGVDGQLREYYRPGRWVPHITLAVDLEPSLIGDALELARTRDVFDTARTVQLAVAQVPPVRELATWDLAT